jgi:hypothetical protein
MIYMLIFTALVSGYREPSIIHTETSYPTVEACHKAYEIDAQQAFQMDVNARVAGTCLSVKHD